MNDELIKTLKYLRMPNLLSRWDEYLATAQKGKLSSVRLLEQIVEDELQCRQNNACERRLKQAKIPEVLVMETFPFDRQKKLDKKKVLSIYDAFDFMDKSQNIVWLGPTGCGKTGLATSFLVEAIRRGAKGRHVFFPELLDELYASVADHSEEAVIKRYVSYDCLLIDEVGYVEVEPVQVGLFFTLMHKRHRKSPTLVTSNLGFGDWRSFLKNDHLTAALIDRLTENSHIINMKQCVSLRSKLVDKP